MCIPVQTGMRQNRWNMRFIGITGGVGAGKTEILQYIEREYPAYVLLADRLAHYAAGNSVLSGNSIVFSERGYLFAGRRF